MIPRARTYRVTPNLWVGEAPMCGATRVRTVERAVEVISSGARAVLPHGEWTTAREVLLALGVDPAYADERITLAQYGTFAATA